MRVALSGAENIGPNHRTGGGAINTGRRQDSPSAPIALSSCHALVEFAHPVCRGRLH